MSESIEGRPSSLPPQPSQSYPAPSNIPATGPPVNPELPTLPYPTQSVLGRKRGYVSGTFAHVLANGPKAPKVSDQMVHAPAHQLTTLYDLEHRNQRHSLLKDARAALKAQREMQPLVVPQVQPTTADTNAATGATEVSAESQLQVPFLQPRPPSGRRTAPLPPRVPRSSVASPVAAANLSFDFQASEPRPSRHGPPTIGQEFISASSSQYDNTDSSEVQGVRQVAMTGPSTGSSGITEAVRWFAWTTESLQITDIEAMNAWQQFSEEDRGEILRRYAQAAAQQNIAASERAFSTVATRRIVAPGNPPISERRAAHPAPALSTSQPFVQQSPPQHFQSQQSASLHRTPLPLLQQSDRLADLPTQVLQQRLLPHQPLQQFTPSVQGVDQPLRHGYHLPGLPQASRNQAAAASQTDRLLPQQAMFYDPGSEDHPMFQDPQPMGEQQPRVMFEPNTMPPPHLPAFSLPPPDNAIAHPQPSRPVGMAPPNDFMMDADGNTILPFLEDTDMGPVAGGSKGKGRAVDEDSTMSVPNLSGPSQQPPTAPARSQPEAQQSTPYPGMWMPRMNQRPTQTPTHTFPEMFASETAVFFMGQIQGVKEAIAEQKEAQAQMMQELHTFMATFTSPGGAGPSRSVPTGDEPSSPPYFETKRDRKLNAPTVREKKRSAHVSKRASRFRGSHVPGDDADDERAMDPDLVEDQHKCRLKARVRHLLEQMLHIDDWATAAAQFPPLTDEQIAAYNKRDGSFILDARNYRIDFKASWKKFAFNKEARSIFIDHYLARVAGGAYFQNPTPPHLLTRENLGAVLDHHMDYCRKRWRLSDNPLDPKKALEIARKAAQTSRRRTLRESRAIIIERRPELRRHSAMFALLEPCNMSGDETDGETKSHPPVFRKRVSRWQSRDLQEFLWKMDGDYRTDWEKPVHRRAMGGNVPRTRVFRAGCVEEGTAPIGLWRNCYDAEWLARQPEYIVRELEIIPEDYDFGLSDSGAT